MPSRTSAVFSADTPRARLLAASLGLVALLQLAAFYTLCADQVRKANARDAGVAQQHAAVTVCLQSSPETTIGGCYAKLRQGYNDGSSALSSALTAGHGAALRDAGVLAMPAHFSFR